MPVSPLIAARTPQIDKNKLRQDWNTYIDWLQSKGLRGSKTLDVGDTPETNEGMKKVREYSQLFPKSLVNPQNVKLIQQEFLDLKERMNKDIRAGRAGMVKEQEIFPGLSSADEKPGSKTTSYKFPESEFKLPSGKKIKTGFVTVGENFPELDEKTKEEIRLAQELEEKKKRAKLSVPIPPNSEIRKPLIKKAQDAGNN